MKKLFINLGWFFGVIFAIGFLSLISSGDIILGIISLLIALSLLPITRKIILKNFPKIKKINLNLTAGLLLLGLIINSIILNQSIEVVIDSYEPGNTYTTETDMTTISGSADVLNEVSVTITQSFETQTKAEDLIIPVVDNRFTFEVPTRNIMIGDTEYKTTEVDIDYFGTITLNRELNEEELAQRIEKQETIAQAQQERIKNEHAQEEAYRNSPEGKICTANPLWTKEACKLIADGKVQIGMTTDQVIASWGKPQDINRTTSVNYTREQWVYRNYQYLYFYDGILETIQQ